MISTEFKQNIESGDLVTVRSALVDYLIIDRTFKKFDEGLDYARTKLDIIQPYDNTPFETETGKWDNGYLNRQKVALMVNFSEERIDHIKKVIHNVLPTNSIQQVETPTSRQVAKAAHENRTGRTVLSEKPVEQKNVYSHNIRPSQWENQKIIRETSAPRNNGRSTTGRTGKRVVSETPTENQRSKEKNKTEDAISTSMIFGGAAIAAVGLVTVEPIVVGTGIVIAGAGVIIKSRR